MSKVSRVSKSAKDWKAVDQSALVRAVILSRISGEAVLGYRVTMNAVVCPFAVLAVVVTCAVGTSVTRYQVNIHFFYSNIFSTLFFFLTFFKPFFLLQILRC